MALRLLPPPALRPIHVRVMDYLPGDGSWRDALGLSVGGVRETMAITAALDELRHVHGMVQARMGRTMHTGRQLIEWRVTAEGRAFKEGR